MNEQQNPVDPIQVEFMFQYKGYTIEVFMLDDKTKQYEFKYDINPN